MASVRRRRWIFAATPGLSRRVRRGCTYEAYVPDPVAGRPITLDGGTAGHAADAEAAVMRLNLQPRSPIHSEAVARLLQRAEAVASSRIEGLEVGGRRLLHAQAEQLIGEQPSDVIALGVLNNIEAMNWAIDNLSDPNREITTSDLLAIHRHLLIGTRLHEYAGRLRPGQNWIGGSKYNPCSAAFVPPPPEHLESLMDDLCAFCNTDSLPAIAQAAVAHAQFETIHPFVDGNGRTGRALIHVILHRRGLATNVLPPVSRVLATRSADYVDALMGTRYRGRPDSRAAQDGLNRWIGLFAAATIRAVSHAEMYEARVGELQGAWRARLGRVRSGSALDLLIGALPGAPVVTVRSAASLIGRSVQAVNEAIPRLVDGGIVRQTTVGHRNRAFEAVELIDAFTALERRMAGPGDTKLSAPMRPVPRRRPPQRPVPRAT